MVAGCTGRPMAAASITCGAQAHCLTPVQPTAIGDFLRKFLACQVQNQ